MKRFRIEVSCTFSEWDRYALHVTAVCFDEAGEMTGYVDLADKTSVLQTPPCDHADIYIYVIATVFPASEVIAASPPFDIELSTQADDEPPQTTLYAVNQWGGLAVKKSLS